MLSQRWQIGITKVAQLYHIGITEVSQRYHVNIISVSHRCHIGITEVSHQYHICIAWVSHLYSIGLTSVSHRYHKVISTVPHRYHTTIKTSVSHQCHIGTPQADIFIPPPPATRRANLSHTTSASPPEAQLIAYYLREPPRPHISLFHKYCFYIWRRICCSKSAFSGIRGDIWKNAISNEKVTFQISKMIFVCSREGSRR